MGNFYEYDGYGILKNEGKYLNGIISNGKGKEYDNDNHLINEGGF